ncbi:MAG: hypothetical protein CK424_03055 [Legionella sp.]|nr:MAG: hypothetical protein CK424_03055 [Legionella sp.]
MKNTNKMLGFVKKNTVIYDGFGIIFLLGIMTFFILHLWDLPPTEDTGYYGFLSKSIQNGSVLHRDIPATTNSIALYITALIFKLTNASLFTYRVIHITGYIFLIMMVYVMMRTWRHVTASVCAAALTAILLIIPHISLDFGRNYIFWALAFVMLASNIYLSNVKNKFIYFGFLLGIASLIRETFLVFPLLYLLGTLIYQFRHDSLQYISKRDLSHFIISLVAALAINAALLSYYDVWAEYFSDMFISGTGFRYKASFTHQISAHLKSLADGYQSYYKGIVLLAISAYCFKSHNKTINYTKYFLFPCAIVEVLIVNKTESYHVITILVPAIILAMNSLSFVYKMIKQCVVAREVTLTGMALLAFCLTSMALQSVPAAFYSIKSEFLRYFDYAHSIKRQIKNNQLMTMSEHTYRMLPIINSIPHAHISACSQYPLLFLSKYNYKPTFPYFEDLFAGQNLSKPSLFKNQLESLAQEIPTLLIIKTTGAYLTRQDPLGKIVANNYISIANFDVSDVMVTAPYYDRVELSKKYFSSSYKTIKTIKYQPDAVSSMKENHNVIKGLYEPSIIKVTVTPKECIKNYRISTGQSVMTYEESYRLNKTLYTFLAADMNAIITSDKKCDPNETVLVEQYVLNY